MANETGAQRDPRIDPHRGDIIRFAGDYRDREIVRVDDSVCVYGSHLGRDIPMSVCIQSRWPEMAKNAKVIHRAD